MDIELAQALEENKNLRDNYEQYKATAEPTIKELKERLVDEEYLVNENYRIAKQLNEAKDLIRELYDIIPASMADYAREPLQKAEEFLREGEQ